MNVGGPVFSSMVSAGSQSYGIARLDSKCECSAIKVLTSFGLVAVRAIKSNTHHRKSFWTRTDEFYTTLK